MTPAQLTALLAAIGGIGGDVFPGTILMYGGATAPTGYLLCDGSAVSRSTYGALFAVLGETFGAGDGTTTFNLPDLLGRVPIGAGAGAGLTARTLGDEGGSEGGTVAKANLTAFSLNVTDPGHTHSITDPGHQHPMEDAGSFVGNAAGSEYVNTGGDKGAVDAQTADANTGITDTNSNATGVTVDSGGSATPLDWMNPFTVVSYIIKT